MMMPAWSVRVAVGLFFGRGIAHVDHLHLKRQRHSGQRMVRINGHLARLDVRDGDDLPLSIRTIRLELHAGLDVGDIFEHLARDVLDFAVIALAIRVGGRTVTLICSPADLPSSSRSRPGMMLPAPCM
jgi:hypothetical protein